MPGLFFMGTHFQFVLASEQVQGVDRDARYVLKHLPEPASMPVLT